MSGPTFALSTSNQLCNKFYFYKFQLTSIIFCTRVLLKILFHIVYNVRNCPQADMKFAEGAIKLNINLHCGDKSESHQSEDC